MDLTGPQAGRSAASDGTPDPSREHTWAFLAALADRIPEALLLVSSSRQAYPLNRAAALLFPHPGDTLAGQTVEHGCINILVEQRPCHETAKCPYCPLFRAVDCVLDQADHGQRRGRFKRTFSEGGRLVERTLQFSVRRTSVGAEALAIAHIAEAAPGSAEDLTAQVTREELNEDLIQASRLQTALLPEVPPAGEPLRFAWLFSPALGIGGDLLDVHRIDRDRACLYVLDVRGHGVAAGLVAMSLSEHLKAIHERIPPGTTPRPAELLEELRRTRAFSGSEFFFSIFHAVLDAEAGELAYASAGHPAGLLVRRAGGIEVLDEHGPALGLGLGEPLETSVLSWGHGDRLVLATDGILEATDAGGERFGQEGLVEALERHRDDPLELMVESIRNEHWSFREGAPADDDLTLLAVECEGCGLR